MILPLVSSVIHCHSFTSYALNLFYLRRFPSKFSQPQKTIPNGWCHQCKSKKDELIVCKNFWKGNQLKCSGKYCQSCVEKTYEEDYQQLIAMDAWICYSCMERCSCANCKRDRGNNIPVRKRTSKKKQISGEKLKEGPEREEMVGIELTKEDVIYCSSYDATNQHIKITKKNTQNYQNIQNDPHIKAIQNHYNSSVDPSIKNRDISPKLFEYWKNDLQRSFQGIHPVEDERINQNLEKMDNYEFDEHDNIIAVHVYYDPNHATNPQKWSDDIYL